MYRRLIFISLLVLVAVGCMSESQFYALIVVDEDGNHTHVFKQVYYHEIRDGTLYWRHWGTDTLTPYKIPPDCNIILG